jgi:hypothetical protein
VTVGMQKIGQQTVGPPASLATHPLNAQPVVAALATGPAPVRTPANQAAAGLAVPMGTTLRQADRSGRAAFGLSILFDGQRKMDYDNHTVEDTFLCG